MAGLVLPGPLQRRLEAAAVALLQAGDGPAVDFSRPPGEPALFGADSLSWQVFRNPVVLFIGGTAASILELAEPRVRSGVWEHTRFRTDPRGRMQRTGLATMLTVYGPASQARAFITALAERHRGIRGRTPAGEAYCAADPPLLDWVHATASFGFLAAYCRHVRPLAALEQDAFYREALVSARLHGAVGAPDSQAALDCLFDDMSERLEASPIVFELLRIVGAAPVLPASSRWLQPLLVRAAVDLLPRPLRRRLRLDAHGLQRHWQRSLVQGAAVLGDRLLLRRSPPVQACRRLGLADDHLYREPAGPTATG